MINIKMIKVGFKLMLESNQDLEIFELIIKILKIEITKFFLITKSW
jgi:hypothetical protein